VSRDIQRQPARNIINVVDRIQNLLPQLKATLAFFRSGSILTTGPPLSAHRKNVQFELMLTVALVSW